MPLIDPKDIPASNRKYLKTTDLPTRPVRIKLLAYKKGVGEKFADKTTGFNHHFKFQLLDSELRKEFGDEQGIVIGSNWNAVGWLIALNNANVGINDIFNVTRTGSGFDTKFHVDKESDVKTGVQAGLDAFHSGAPAPVVADEVDTAVAFDDDKDEVTIDEIPF